MDKPVQLMVADLKAGLSNVINNAQLPMVCITPVIKELYENCTLIEREQFMQAKGEYEKNWKQKTIKRTKQVQKIQKTK